MYTRTCLHTLSNNSRNHFSYTNHFMEMSWCFCFCFFFLTTLLHHLAKEIGSVLTEHYKYRFKASVSNIFQIISATILSTMRLYMSQSFRSHAKVTPLKLKTYEIIPADHTVANCLQIGHITPIGWSNDVQKYSLARKSCLVFSLLAVM